MNAGEQSPTVSAAASPLSAFDCGNVRALRDAGLLGNDLRAKLHDGSLELRGESAGRICIEARQVFRLRLGYVEGRRRLYVAQVTCAIAPHTLRLVPYPHTWAGYATTMRDFAAGVQRGGGIVESGYSKSDALVAPVLFGVVALGAIYVALFVLDGQPWWGRLLVPVVPIALTALFAWLGYARQWPRPLHDVVELNGVLPPSHAEDRSPGRTL